MYRGVYNKGLNADVMMKAFHAAATFKKKNTFWNQILTLWKPSQNYHQNKYEEQIHVHIHYQNCYTLGNLPVERAKDAVCFLQRCGVSPVSWYAVCFLQQGGVSLASSAIIYNIVKVKVTRWPVDLFDPLTHWPVDPLSPCAFCSGVAWAWHRLLSYII